MTDILIAGMIGGYSIWLIRRKYKMLRERGPCGGCCRDCRSCKRDK